MLVRRSLQFYGTVCEMLLKLATGSSVKFHQMPVISPEVHTVFAALPEWCMEDIADFILMSMQLVFFVYIYSTFYDIQKILAV